MLWDSRIHFFGYVPGLTIPRFLSVLEQPMKIPFVAATVLVAHSLKPELGSTVVEKAGHIAQKYLEQGAWREVKLLLRFMGCLQPVFEGEGIFPLLEELFSRAVDLQTASSEDVSSGLTCGFCFTSNNAHTATWP